MLPGTHRAEHPLHRKLGAAHSDAVRGVEEWEAAPEHADAEGEADVAVAAGDLVLGDARLLRGTHPNTSPERRTVITLWYLPGYGRASAA